MRPHVADFNGDGIPDIMVSDTGIGFSGDYQSLYLSNDNSTWTHSTFSNVKNVKRHLHMVLLWVILMVMVI